MGVWIKRTLAILFAGLLIIVTIVIFNTWQLKPDAIVAGEPLERDVNAKRAADSLAKAISFETVSTDPDNPGFAAFRAWLPSAYAEFHKVAEAQTLGGGTLLYKWSGTDTAAKPVLLTGHYDVVPVDSSSPEAWTYPAFAGTVADGYIWGRGALDNKSAVIAILEAAEALAAKGFQPKRTIYFSFGHDEEIGGFSGAAAVVQNLKDQNVQLEWSLDEGSYVLDDIFPGLDNPVASINLAEKGSVSLLVTAKGQGGHSSMPPQETAVGVLAEAIGKIQNNPLPGGLSGLSEDMFNGIAPHLGFSQRMAFANRWLFGGMLEQQLSKTASTNAMLRTTTAPTMLSASVKENVLPMKAVATVNFRIHPRDSVDGVLQYVQDLVGSDKVDVQISGGRGSQASAVSSQDSDGYKVIAKSFHETFGTLIILPGLTVAGTDSKHYAKVADDAYRINPFIVGKDDIARFHGLDERISVENMGKGVTYFTLLMEGL